jgi:hypothetical protein
MRECLSTVVVMCLCMLSLPDTAASQRLYTANTLELDEAASRPNATLADISLLVGPW